MSISSPRESELSNKLRQSDRENRQLKEELDERAALLQKTKAAIEDLQLKLQQKLADEEELRQEATRVINDQTQTIAAAERDIQELESQVHELESQLREANLSVKHGSNAAQTASHEAKLEVERLKGHLKERDMRIMALQAELDASQETVQALEHAAKEQRATLHNAQSGLASETALRKQGEERSGRLLEEKQALEARLEALRLEMAASQHKFESTAQARITEVANLQAECTGKQKEIIGLMEQLTTTEQVWQAKMSAANIEHAEKTQALELKLANASKGQSYNWEAHEHEWTRRLQEVEMHWEKRLRDGMVACERKFEEEAGDTEKRVRDVEAQWQANIAGVEAQWAARLSEHQRAMDMHRAQVEGQQAALLAESAQAAMQAEVEQGLRAKLDEYELRMAGQAREAHAAVQAERAAADRLWAGRLESAQVRWAHDMAAAAEQVAEAKAQAEADAAHNAELIQQAAATRVAAVEAAHKRALEAAQSNWQQEREALQKAWQQRHREAEQMHKVMQGQLQAKVAAITARLTAITQREGTLDVSRREVMQQLEDLQSTYEAELQRRAESEAAARNAAQLCRSQLEDLREQVDLLQHQLREVNQLPHTTAKHSSLLETALAAPSIASPTWPASPRQLDSIPHKHHSQGFYQYAIAPPSTAHLSTRATKPMSGRDTKPAPDQDENVARRVRSAGGPVCAWHGSSSNPPPDDSEVMTALQELRSAGISPNRPSAPASAGKGANAGGAGMTGHSLGGHSSTRAPFGFEASPNFSMAAATQGGSSSPWPPLSPLLPNPTPLNHSTHTSNASLAHLAQPPPSSNHYHTQQHHSNALERKLSELSISQQYMASPRGRNSPPASLIPGSQQQLQHVLLHSPHAVPQPRPPTTHGNNKPTTTQSVHSSSELEAIQQQLAAMRSTVAASAAAHRCTQASMPPPPNPRPGASTTSHKTPLEAEAFELASQAAGSMLEPPVLDRSESLLSPAAAKYLMRYREQMKHVDLPLPSAPNGGASKSAAPYRSHNIDHLSTKSVSAPYRHEADHLSSGSVAAALNGADARGKRSLAASYGLTDDAGRGLGADSNGAAVSAGAAQTAPIRGGHGVNNHSAAPSLAGFESILVGNTLNGRTGGNPLPASEAGLGAPTTHTEHGALSANSSTVGGSSIGAGSGIRPALTQRQPYLRTRSVVRSLEPTLSGAASQASHQL